MFSLKAEPYYLNFKHKNKSYSSSSMTFLYDLRLINISIWENSLPLLNNKKRYTLPTGEVVELLSLEEDRECAANPLDPHGGVQQPQHRVARQEPQHISETQDRCCCCQDCCCCCKSCSRVLSWYWYSASSASNPSSFSAIFSGVSLYLKAPLAPLAAFTRSRPFLAIFSWDRICKAK